MDRIRQVNQLDEGFKSVTGLKSPNSITFEKVLQAERHMQLSPQVELRVEHDFSYGVYSRTLYIPKGIALTGHIHKYENFNILVKGKMSVLVDGQMQTIEAPFKVVSPPGTKRIAWALEDSIWMTIHGTHEKDLDVIEKVFIAHTKEEYLEFAGYHQLALELTK